MHFFDELLEIKRRLISWTCFLLLFTLFFFIFPSPNSLSVQFLGMIRSDLVPQGADLILTSPISGFLVQMGVALFLGFLATFPILIFHICGFIFPALHEKERKAIVRVLIPSAILFFLGCIFSYSFLIPFTFDILYSFTLSVGALPFFELNNFLSLVFGLMMATGILFLLPVFMVLLSIIGIIKPEFWKKQSSYAILFFVIISAIITPDGTGITLLILTVLLTILYFIGYFLSKMFTRSKKKNNN